MKVINRWRRYTFPARNESRRSAIENTIIVKKYMLPVNKFKKSNGKCKRQQQLPPDVCLARGEGDLFGEMPDGGTSLRYWLAMKCTRREV